MGICILLPGREQLGVLMAFPYALGMLMWGVFMVPSHLLIMSLIFALERGLVWPIGRTTGVFSRLDTRLSPSC